MKKIITLLVVGGLAVPAFACPGMEHEQASPQTAKKDDKAAPEKKEQPKQDTGAKKTTTDAQKTKTPDKVSSK
ncbi:MAG: hypothetical protein QM831_40055 [Kofleriaceae bacterium]